MLIRNQQDQIFYQSRLNSYEDGLQRLRQQLELDSFQEVQRGEQLHHHELASRQLLREQAFPRTTSAPWRRTSASRSSATSTATSACCTRRPRA